MSAIEDIKRAIATSWPTVPGAELSVRLLEFVIRLPEAETRLMTMPMLARGVGRQQVDQDLLTAITILVSSRLELLQPRAMLIEDDEQEFEVGPDELSAARAEGVLAHPETGEPVSDFESKLYPYFVPTERLKAIMQNAHGA